jgi:hypothetical protein
MADDHFVETNLVIGYTVDWDRHMEVVENYISSSGADPIYTSDRVLNEAEKVITDRRRLAVQAANQVYREFEGSPPISVDDVVGFVWKVLSNQQNSAVDHVIQYIEQNQSLYKGLIEANSSNFLKLTIEDIQSDFRLLC